MRNWIRTAVIGTVMAGAMGADRAYALNFADDVSTTAQLGSCFVVTESDLANGVARVGIDTVDNGVTVLDKWAGGSEWWGPKQKDPITVGDIAACVGASSGDITHLYQKVSSPGDMQKLGPPRSNLTSPEQCSM